MRHSCVYAIMMSIEYFDSCSTTDLDYISTY